MSARKTSVSIKYLGGDLCEVKVKFGNDWHKADEAGKAVIGATILGAARVTFPSGWDFLIEEDKQQSGKGDNRG